MLTPHEGRGIDVTPPRGEEIDVNPPPKGEGNDISRPPTRDGHFR